MLKLVKSIESSKLNQTTKAISGQILINETSILANYLIFAISFLLCASTLSAQAQGAISPSLAVNPAIVRMSIKPAVTSTYNIELSNFGRDALPISVEQINLVGISETGTPEFSQSPQPRSARKWITVNPSDLILEAGSKRVVTISVTAPENTAPGGYHSALVFQPKLPSYYFDLDANARVLPALTISILLSIDPTNPPTIKDLKVERFVTPKIVVSSPISLISEIRNPTNFFIYANGQMLVEPMIGKTQKVTELNSSILFPESKRKFTEAYTGRLIPGVYTARLELQHAEQLLVASSRFVAIPWQFLTSFLFVVGLIVFLAGRRRLKKAWEILIHGHKEPPKQRPIIR